MKLAIFGATGPTGLELTKQALSMGHEVVALARNPARMTVSSEKLRVVQGNVLDAAAVERVIGGSDVVLSCLGIRPFAPKGTQSRAMHNILTAMQKVGVRRLVVESAYGVGESRALATPLAFTLLLSWTYNDKEVMEAEVKRSGMDWTIVRPPQLRDGPRTGKYRVGDDLRLGLGTWINRADVAEFMLQQAVSTKWAGKAPTISAN